MTTKRHFPHTYFVLQSFPSFLFLLLLLAQPLCAEEIKDILPATFSRVTSLNELEEKYYYVLGAVDGDGKMWMLSAEQQTGLSSSNKKLKALGVQEWTEQSVQISNIQVVWKIEKASDSTIILYAAESGQYANRHKGKTNLELTAEKGNYCSWVADISSDQTFTLRSTERDNYFFALDYTFQLGNKVFYFGNYASSLSNTIYLFRCAIPFSHNVGAATLPADKERVALKGEKFVRATSGEVLGIDTLELRNGKIAPSPTLAVWTCEYADTTNNFYLKGDAGYLDYDLQTAAAPATWQIVNGHIATTETPARYLCYEAATQTWRVEDEENARVDAGFISVDTDPAATLSADGVLSLTGGWANNALASLDLAKARCLDLTNISLPVNTQEFQANLAERNVPIFIKGEAKEYVPETWRFVVACGSPNKLLRQTELVDKAAFYTDRDFSVTAGQLTYQRSGEPNTWQTLALPFDATISGARVYAITDIGEEDLTLEEVSALSAAAPYLIYRRRRERNVYEQGGSVTCTSKAGTVKSKTANAGAFLPTFSFMQVSTETDVFMLHPEKSSFYPAATGSKLYPFRCYLKLTGAQSRPLNFRPF